jgi:hypothetical protein
MSRKQNQEPLAGGLLAGVLQAEHVDIREALIKQAQRRMRREHLARRVHRLGPRVVAELLDEIARHHGLHSDIDRRLERYARLDPALLRALGADKFPPSPIRVVGGAR